MKNVLILGSNSDVGKACAEVFAENGANLFLAARSQDENQERIKKDLQIRFKTEVSTHRFDALDYDSHQDFWNSIKDKVDTVISVFGVLGDHQKAIADPRTARDIIESNFLGNVSILGIIANDFEAKQRGIIACVSSVAGERGRMSNYIYGSSKAGLSAYLSGLRNRLSKSNVHVLTVQPGFIRTKMIKGLETPGPLTAAAQEVANSIYTGCKKKKNIVFVKPVWRWIMLVIRSIPEFIFKKLSL